MAATKPANWSHAISDQDHGPLVTICACLMLVASFLFMGFRLTIRWPWSKLVGYDDLATIIGTLFACGQSAAIFRSVHMGLGQHRADLGEVKETLALEAAFVSDILSVFALTGSKLAVSLLILRLSTFKRHLMVARIVSVLICVWGVVAAILIGLETKRTREENRVGWIIVGTWSMALEMSLFIMPIFLVWNLRMRLSSKVTVVVGFAFRLPASALALARVLTVVKMLSSEYSSDSEHIDFTWDYVNPTIFTTIEMHYSLMAATIPCMHLFLRQFSTGYLGTTNEQLQGTIMGSGGQSDSYVMSSIGKRHHGAELRRRTRPEKTYSEWEAVSRALYQVDAAVTTITANRETRPESIASDGSEKIMVRQEVDVKWQDSPPK